MRIYFLSAKMTQSSAETIGEEIPGQPVNLKYVFNWVIMMRPFRHILIHQQSKAKILSGFSSAKSIRLHRFTSSITNSRFAVAEKRFIDLVWWSQLQSYRTEDLMWSNSNNQKCARYSLSGNAKSCPWDQRHSFQRLTSDKMDVLSKIQRQSPIL